jgi:hypothetical protein
VEITGSGFASLIVTSETLLDILLRIERIAGGGVRVSWPLSASGYLLDETTMLNGSPISWMQVPVSAYQTNSPDISIGVPGVSGNKFYRLRRP